MFLWISGSRPLLHLHLIQISASSPAAATEKDQKRRRPNHPPPPGIGEESTSAPITRNETKPWPFPALSARVFITRLRDLWPSFIHTPCGSEDLRSVCVALETESTRRWRLKVQTFVTWVYSSIRTVDSAIFTCTL
jgi:hypothetical protein